MGESTRGPAGIVRLVDVLEDAILLIDGAGVICHANPAAVAILDQTSSRLLNGLDSQKILLGEIENPSPPPRDGSRRTLVQRPHGQTLPLDMVETTIDLDGDSWKLIALWHPKNEFDDDRFSIDVLCSRFGHQFANLLTPLMGYIELTRLDADPNGEIADMMGSFMNISRRMLVHVQNLLMLRHRPIPVFHSNDLRKIIGDAVKAARETGLVADHLVTVTLQGSDEALPIPSEADLPVLMIQNLILNAAESMKGAGTIEVNVTRFENSAEIRVADAGPGIPPDLREKVFEPFFSSKANGRGIGLGLYVARRIAERHRGSIRVGAHQPRGTVITIQLPLADR